MTEYEIAQKVLQEWMNLPTGPGDEQRIDEFEGYLEYKIKEKVEKENTND